MEKSPFQRLPAEIRVAIYTLVLGGSDIHVRNVNNLMSYSICAEPVSHYGAMQTIKSRPLHDLHFPEAFDHYDCATNGFYSQPRRVRLDMALLQTCRQIHQEAALLPFKTNTFVFSNPVQLQFFENSLPGEQREAVTSVCFVTSYVESVSRNFSVGPGIHRLSGLRRLIIVLGVANRTTADDIKRFLAEAEESFGRHSLAAADIIIRSRKSKRSYEEFRYLFERYTQWARETEQALLKPADDAAG